MSTTVDQRVVEMQFDNRHFEQNVSHTMSTLDKLKQKLHLPGAAKSLEDVGNAAKKVDMSPLAHGVENVRMKFSAMEVIGVTALANITNSAVNAGKRIVSALTIDPIKTGLSEYETHINATQTILANTQSKGTTIDDVNRALEELNTYADKTIYNFTEMTRNIGTFTAAGIDLETSTNAIQGIANLAAVSGSTSQQASTAMYQLSQALASGTVKLMDWNSVVNAGMGGQVFQDALKETARVHGIAIDDMITKHGSFRESLKEGWITSEILTETLQKFTLTTEGLTEAEIEANREMLRAKGYTEKQIEEIFKLGNTATDAATKVKTFTQMWDVLKEAAQSGWAKTWKILIGDFEQAKALLTPLSEFLTGIVNRMSDFRNAVLESALAKGFGKLSNSIKEILKPALKAVDAVKEVTDTVTDLGAIVDDVILGNWGNGQTRFDALAKAGYNYCEVQNKVNEKLGNGYRYTQEQINAQNELLGKTKKTIEKTGEQAEATESQSEATAELTEEEKKRIKALAKMSDEQLRAAGLSEKQIAALKELKNTAAKLGIPFDEFIDKLDEINGRWLLINGFKNIGKGLIGVFKAIGQAWQDIFPNSTNIEYISNGLFNLIAGFSRLTSKLVMNKEEADKLRRTFAGVFAILDIVMTLTSGPLKIAFKIITKILSLFNLNILDVTAFIGDAIVKFRDWLDSVLDFDKAFDALVTGFKNAPKAIKGLWNSFKQSKIFQAALPLFQALRDKIISLVNAVKETRAFKAVVNFFTPFLDGIKSWWKGLKEAENIPKYLFEGLWKGIQNGASKIWDTISNVIVKLIEIVKNVLGIHSPSTVFMAIGGFIVAGLLVGLTNAFPGVWDAIGGFVDNILAIVGKVDWGSILTGIISAGAVASMYKFMSFLKGVGDMLGGVGDVLSGTGDILKKSAGAVKKVVNNTAKVIKSFSKVLDGVAWDIKAGAIQKFAIAIGILVAAIVVLALMFKSDLAGHMWHAVGMIAVLAAVLVGMAYAIDKMSGASASIDKTGVQIKGMSSIIIQMGICMLLLAATMKIIGGMSWGDLAKGGALMVAFSGLVVGLMAASKLAGGDPIKSARNIARISALIKAVGTTFLLLAITAKIIGTMSWDEMKKAGAGLVVFGGILGGLFALTKYGAFNVDKLATMISKIGIAFLLLALTAKIIGGMSWDEMKRAGAGIIVLGGIIVGLIAATKLAGNRLGTIGKTILAVAGAMTLLAITAKIIATMSWDDMGRAAVGIVALGVIIVLLMKAVSNIGADGPKMAATLLAAAGAIAILALVMAALSLVVKYNPGNLVIALGLVALLSAIMVWLIKATENASYANKTITALAILIGVLAAAMIALSFIPWQNLIAPVIAMGVVIAALWLPLNALSKFKHGASAMGMVLGLAAIIAVLGTSLILLAHTPWQQSLAAAAGMSVVLLALAGAFKIIAGSGIIVQSLSIMIMMAVIIGVLGTVMTLLAHTPFNQCIGAAIAMGGVLMALAGAFKIIAGAQRITQTLPVLIMMTVMIGVIGTIMVLLANLPTTNAIVSAAALSITLLALAGAMKILSTMKSIDYSVIAALLIMTAAIAVLGTVMSLIGGMGGSGVVTSLVAIAAGLVILVVAINMMKGTIEGSIALLIAAGALVVLANAMMLLSGLSLEQVIVGLIALGGAIAILCIAGKLLGGTVIYVLALAGAILMLGVAVLAFGAGVLLFGQGLTAIATGFAALTQSLAQNGPAFVEALLATIAAAIAGFVLLKPRIILAGIELIIGFIEGVTSCLPRIIQAAIDMVIAFINGLADGIRNNTGKVLAAVLNLIDAILSPITGIFGKMLKVGGELIGKLGSGISSAFGKIVEVGKNLVAKLLEPIKNAVSKFLNVGKDLAKGLVEGIKNIVPNAIAAVKNLGSSVLDAICKVLGIASPSKEFMAIGEFSGLGFAEGLMNSSGTVNTAASGVATGALDAFKDVFSGADGSIDLGKMFNADGVTSDGLVVGTDGLVEGIKMGAIGDRVKALQEALNVMLRDAGLDEIVVDGKWLSQTDKAFRWAEEQLGFTADGILSEEEVTAIESRLERIQTTSAGIGSVLDMSNEIEKYRQSIIDYATSGEEFAKFSDANKASAIKKLNENLSDDDIRKLIDATEDQKALFNDLMLGIVETHQILVGIEPFDSTKARFMNGILKNDINTVDELFESRFIEKLPNEMLSEWLTKGIRKNEELAKLWDEYSGGVNLSDELTSAVDAALETDPTMDWTKLKRQLEKRGTSYDDLLDHFVHLNAEQQKAFIEEFKESVKDPSKNRMLLLEDLAEKYMGYDTAVGSSHYSSSNPVGMLAGFNPDMIVAPVEKVLGSPQVTGVATKSAKDLVKTYADGINSAFEEDVAGIFSKVGKHIQNLFNIINPDMEIQPTIAPVLDLSNVQTGVSAINSWLGGNSSIGLSANVDGIIRAMNKENQNGAEEVVSAISKLRDDIASMDKNVYHINGVTYNEGSEVGNAIKVIARTATRTARSGG